MITQAFSVFDTAAGVYSPPFFSITKGLAIRMFSDMAKDPKTSIGQHPNDFTLFALGEFDDNSGAIISLPTPVPIIKANETLTEEV